MGVEIKENTTNKLHVEYDVSKIFLRNNRTIQGTLTNSTGVDLSITPGQLMGRVAADEKIAILKSGSVDGSEIPLGVLMSEVIDLPNTESITVTVVISGDVAEEKVLFDGADDFTTDVAGRSLRDRIAGDTAGIFLSLGEDLTNSDNS